MPKVIQPLNPSVEPDSSPNQQQPEPVARPVQVQSPSDFPAQFASNPITPYPTASSAALEEKDTHLPVGVYIIAGLIMLQGGFGFFATPANGAGLIQIIVSIIFALAAAGLLLRREAARLAVVVIAIITIVLSGFTIFSLQVLQARMQNARASYNAAIELAKSQQQLSSTQRATVDNNKKALENLEKQATKNITAATITQVAFITLSGACIFYLTRQKVRGYF